jgi:hypothetical protein
MDPAPQPRPDLDLTTASTAEIEEALASWDDLPPQTLERLATHPVWGGRLATLQLADAWLAEQGPSERPPEVARCPEADELFDYGRGPGARPLAARRRAQIDRHVLGCEECRTFAASLASRPPVPLADGLPASIPTGSLPAPARRERPQAAPVIELERARRWRPRVLVPLAAAAALAVAALTALRPGPSLAAPGWPERPVDVRGAEAGELIAPRGTLLAAGPGAAWTGLAARPAPVFELRPVPGAEAYRVELARTDGSALGEGELLATLETPAPADATSIARLAGPALEPGRYTWRAFAVVNGLETALGPRDFAVAADPELTAALAELEPADEPARSQTAVRLLDERGHLADARAVARRLPASAGRDEYLSRFPQR